MAEIVLSFLEKILGGRRRVEGQLAKRRVESRNWRARRSTLVFSSSSSRAWKDVGNKKGRQSSLGRGEREQKPHLPLLLNHLELELGGVSLGLDFFVLHLKVLNSLLEGRKFTVG